MTNALLRVLGTHLLEVKNGGWKVGIRKSRSLAKRFLSFLLIIVLAPLVFLVILVRPLVLLRFGVMTSSRIGHFIGDVEAYHCARDIESEHRCIVDIIGCPKPVCNYQVMSMWKRTQCITPGGKLWKYLDTACCYWTKSESHHIKLYDRSRDYALFSKTRPHLGFTDEERQRGQDLLAQLGIPSGASWICIHNRDPAYLDTTLNGCWKYHDYRNFGIHSMVEAAEELTKRGYYIFRVGSVVEENIKSNNPMVIDYASSGLRSDFADIYLMAECSAYIGSDSGIYAVPFVFRKPVYFVNFSSTLIDRLLDQGIGYPFIFKRLWHRQKQRFLSLREMFEAGLVGAAESHLFDEAGVEPVCNTSDEILDLAIEVDERLRSLWRPQLADEELQRRFWESYDQYSPIVRVRDFEARIGAAFLRKHIDLLN